MNLPLAPLAVAGLAAAAFALSGCDAMAESSSLAYADPPPAYESVLSAVNRARAAGQTCGGEYFAPVQPVEWNGRLERAAEAHTLDMVYHEYFDHVGTDGSTVGDRASRAGYNWRRVGENLARTWRSGGEVVGLWLASPGHCANLMHPSFTEMGVYEQDGYWTQVFGRQR